MKLLNNHGLHEGLFHAVHSWFFEKQNPNPPHFRVTELIRPVQQVVLQRRHHDELETDVMDLMNAWRGSAVHEFLSRHDKTNALQEFDLEIEMAGEKLKGKPDYYEDGTIVDFKNCRVWSYIYKSSIQEWTDQLNIYAFMLKSMGFPVTALEIVAIFDDWSATEAKRNADYPRTRSVVIPILMYPDAKTKELLEDRIFKLSSRLSNFPDADLPECTPEEMWEDPTKYAVMKEGRKSAVKLHDEGKAAEKHAKELGKGHSVQVRPGVRKRCESYCGAAPFCHQYKRYLAEKAEETGPEYRPDELELSPGAWK